MTLILTLYAIVVIPLFAFVIGALALSGRADALAQHQLQSQVARHGEGDRTVPHTHFDTQKGL